MDGQFVVPMVTDISDLRDFQCRSKLIATTVDLGQRLYDLFTDLSYSSVDMISKFAHLTDQNYGDYMLDSEDLQRAQAFAKAKIAEEFAAEYDDEAERMYEVKDRFYELFRWFLENQDLVEYCAGGGETDRIASIWNCAGYFAAVHGLIDIQDEYDLRTVDAYYEQYLQQCLDQF